MWSAALSPKLSFASVIRLQTNALTAREAAIASGMPWTSRLGTRLVNKEPGPIVIRSALAIASKVLWQGPHVGRIEMDLNDASSTGGDICFSHHASAIGHQCFQLHVRDRRRINVATGGQNLRGLLHRLGKIAGDSGQSGEK